MLPIAIAAEPHDFNDKVRKPGLRAIRELCGLDPPTPPRVQVANRPQDIPADKLTPYWRECLADLHRAYEGYCAYLALFIEPIDGPTVDHFVAKSKSDPRLAYDWANYRLAHRLMNTRKRDFDDVLDPATIGDDWFRLNLLTCEVLPNLQLPADIAAQIEDTIERLNLNSSECIELRERMLDEYDAFESHKREHVPLWHIKRRYPFLYREMIKQQWLRTADRPPPATTPAP